MPAAMLIAALRSEMEQALSGSGAYAGKPD
jgi:hypothetical protein